MNASPKLVDLPDSATAPRRGAVLHGGASRRGKVGVSPTQLSVLRMVPIARQIARAADRRLAVFRVLNSRRGWDTSHTPVRDVHWALDEVARRIGAPPRSCLVGHSLGGRAAILAAGRPEVRASVALAPWVYSSDVPAGTTAGASSSSTARATASPVPLAPRRWRKSLLAAPTWTTSRSSVARTPC